MKKRKFMTSIVLVLSLVMMMTFTGCGDNTGNDKANDENMAKIGILQLMEHPSLNTIRESIIEGLAEKGFVDGETITIDYQNGQNDMSIMKSIAQKFVSGGYDAIIAIATPAAQAVLSETTDIPIIFSAVTDPVGAGLVDSLDEPNGNVTGTSDEVSAEAIIELAKKITPDFKKIGALYSAGEANSQSVVSGLKDYAKKNGYEVIESKVTNSSEVQQSAQYLADKVDIVYSPIDNTVASAMAIATDIFNGDKIPFYVSADSMVKDGGLATYGIDYTVLGKETGYMASEILSGKAPSELPVRKMNEMSIYVNKHTAEALGVEVPQDIISKATVFE